VFIVFVFKMLFGLNDSKHLNKQWVLILKYILEDINKYKNETPIIDFSNFGGFNNFDIEKIHSNKNVKKYKDEEPGVDSEAVKEEKEFRKILITEIMDMDNKMNEKIINSDENINYLKEKNIENINKKKEKNTENIKEKNQKNINEKIFKNNEKKIEYFKYIFDKEIFTDNFNEINYEENIYYMNIQNIKDIPKKNLISISKFICTMNSTAILYDGKLKTSYFYNKPYYKCILII
jgi:hypothetical protein